MTDGQYELGVNRKLFTLPAAAVTGTVAGGCNELIVSTTYTGNWYVEVMDAATSGSWLTVQTAGAG